MMLQPEQHIPVLSAKTDVDDDRQPVARQPPDSDMTSLKSAVFPNLARGQMTFFAVILILAGILSVGCNITELVLSRAGNESNNVQDIGIVCHGIWAGLVSVFVGAMAASAARKKTKCLVVSCELLCVLTTLAALAQLALGIVGAVVGPKCYFSFYHTDFVGKYYGPATTFYGPPAYGYDSYNRFNAGNDYQTFYDVPCFFKYSLIIFIMHIAMAGLGLVQALSAIAIWIWCCRAHGCCTFWIDCFKGCCASLQTIRQKLEGTYGIDLQNRNITDPLMSAPTQMTSQLPQLAGNQQFIFVPVLLPANYQPIPGQMPVQGLAQFGNGMVFQPFSQLAPTLPVNQSGNSAAGQPSSRPLVESVQPDYRDTVLLLSNDGNDNN